jgi:hypothetical protein
MDTALSIVLEQDLLRRSQSARPLLDGTTSVFLDLVLCARYGEDLGLDGMASTVLRSSGEDALLKTMSDGGELLTATDEWIDNNFSGVMRNRSKCERAWLAKNSAGEEIDWVAFAKAMDRGNFVSVDWLADKLDDGSGVNNQLCECLMNIEYWFSLDPEPEYAQHYACWAPERFVDLFGNDLPNLVKVLLNCEMDHSSLYLDWFVERFESFDCETFVGDEDNSANFIDYVTVDSEFSAAFDPMNLDPVKLVHMKRCEWDLSSVDPEWIVDMCYPYYHYTMLRDHGHLEAGKDSSTFEWLMDHLMGATLYKALVHTKHMGEDCSLWLIAKVCFPMWEGRPIDPVPESIDGNDFHHIIEDEDRFLQEPESTLLKFVDRWWLVQHRRLRAQAW